MADCSLTAAERSDPLALEQAVLRRRTSFSQRSLGKGVYCYKKQFTDFCEDLYRKKNLTQRRKAAKVRGRTDFIQPLASDLSVLCVSVVNSCCLGFVFPLRLCVFA
jgi:hypothetical protein